MIKVILTDTCDQLHEIDAPTGCSLMEAATANLVPGIEGECGGGCSCGTCHVYIDPAWRDKVGAPNPSEAVMLSSLEHVRDNSRLCCQISLSEELDGLRATVAPPE